jgi:hippurate hydrolase
MHILTYLNLIKIEHIMTIAIELEQLSTQMRQWRQHLHQFPETAFEENQTSDYIADILQNLGLQTHRGLGKTGVVASLRYGNSTHKIALRADIDALPITEQNSVPYASQHPGKMHACGHDGHTAMLLGAAHYLTQYPKFNGTVYFIFQPAEEGGAGAQRMIEDGLFDLFPATSVYGLHNFPGIPQGHFAIKSGAMMASADRFEISLHGQGTHAAIPHLGDDVIVASAELVCALQTIVSRHLDPAETAVVSITQIHAGTAWNVLPEQAVIRGTFRCFKPELQQMIRERISQLSQHIAQAHGITANVLFNHESPGYPVTINSVAEAAIATEVAEELVGKDKVFQPVPSMGAEDFSFMLQQKPGCYAWIGHSSTEGGCLLHNPHYDFNDAILTLGAAYWVGLVEKILI